MNTTPDTIVSQNSSIIASDLDGETMMMSIERGEYYAIEAIGSHIWNIIKEPTSVANICEHLVSEFDVDMETCHSEVQIFINELYELKVIELS